jgi:hypothetical protein
VVFSWLACRLLFAGLRCRPSIASNPLTQPQSGCPVPSTVLRAGSSRILRRAGTGLPAASDLRRRLTPLDAETKSLPIPDSPARVLAGAKARIFSSLIAALKRHSSTKRRSSTAIGVILTLASLAGRTKASVPTQAFCWAAHATGVLKSSPNGLHANASEKREGSVQESNCPTQAKNRIEWATSRSTLLCRTSSSKAGAKRTENSP